MCIPHPERSKNRVRGQSIGRAFVARVAVARARAHPPTWVYRISSTARVGTSSREARRNDESNRIVRRRADLVPTWWIFFGSRRSKNEVEEV